MGDLGPLIIIVAVLASLAARVVGAAKRQQGGGRAASATTPDAPGPQSMAGLLAEMRREVERARTRQEVTSRTTLPTQPTLPGREGRRPRPPAKSRTPTGESVAVESIRPVRAVVDYDLESAKVAASRAAAAEVMAEGRQPGEHAAFDQRIRQGAVSEAPPSHQRGRLRTAIIWQEILGPPVALRPPTE